MRRGITAFLFVMIALTGCETTRPNWSGNIDPQPPQKQEYGEQATWLDGHARWNYSVPFDESRSIMNAEGWAFEENSISLRLKAIDNLNYFEDAPHTLLVRVYQLMDPNVFNDYKQTKTGLQDLLIEETPDPSFLASKRLIMNPGQETVLVLDRAQSAKYIAIVAGYTALESAANTRLLSIPPVYDFVQGQKVTERIADTLETFNPFADPPQMKPGRLKVWVNLGKNKVDTLEARAH